MNLSNRQALYSDIVESLRADKVAQRSRNNVFKRLGGVIMWRSLIVLIFLTAAILMYYHGYLYGYTKPAQVITKTDLVTVREVGIVAPTCDRKLPKTGADLSSN